MSRTDESVLASLASVLSAPGTRIGMGEHAALRRMNPLAPGGASVGVYRLLAAYEIPLDDEDLVQRWCLIVHALALAHGAHDKRTKIGAGMREMRFTDSELRVNQLLTAGFENLAQLVPRFARRLRNSEVPALDFTPLMRLILAVGRNEADAHRARLAIARSVARHPPKESTT